MLLYIVYNIFSILLSILNDFSFCLFMLSLFQMLSPTNSTVSPSVLSSSSPDSPTHSALIGLPQLDTSSDAVCYISFSFIPDKLLKS